MRLGDFGAPEQRTSDDYYTPPRIFTDMGIRFDLDPCSPPGGLPWIPADRIFTLADDGLSQPWAGRVWMNPPYSRATPWVRRFLDHANGVALLPFAKSAWFDAVWNSAASLVAPGVNVASEFVGGSISYPVFLAAFGEASVDAIKRCGPAR